MMNTIREFVGEMLRQSMRGFELALAGITLINAHAVLVSRADGSNAVPFLVSWVRNVPDSPQSVAGLLAVYAVALFVLWSMTMEAEGERRLLRLRALAYGILGVFYLGLSFAIIEGHELLSVANRYSYSAFLAICCSAIHLRLHEDLQARGD